MSEREPSGFTPDEEGLSDPSILEDIQLSLIDNKTAWDKRIAEARESQMSGGALPVSGIDEKLAATDALITGFTRYLTRLYPMKSEEAIRDLASRLYRYTKAAGEYLDSDPEKLDEIEREIFSRPPDNSY